MGTAGIDYKNGQILPKMTNEINSTLGKTRLRDYNTQYGITTDWNPDTEIAMVSKPGGNSLSFRKAQGGIYGIGFDPNTGFHYVDNPDVYNSYMGINSVSTPPSPATGMPTGSTPPSYTYVPSPATGMPVSAGQTGQTGQTQLPPNAIYQTPTYAQSPPVSLPQFQSVPTVQYNNTGGVNPLNLQGKPLTMPEGQLNPQYIGPTGELPSGPAQLSGIGALKLAENQLGITEQPFQAQRTAQIEQLINNLPTYAPQYRQQILDALNKMNTPFSYDPYSDTFLKNAQGEAQKSVMDEMNRRGILSSTVTVDRAAQETAKLVPQYEAIAYQRYNDNLNRQLQNVEFLNKLDTQDYEAYKTQIDNIFQRADVLNNLDLQDFEVYKQNLSILHNRANTLVQDSANVVKQWEKKVQLATDRTDQLGYVDNAASLILGLPPGTLSKEARQRVEDAKAYLNQLNLGLDEYKQKLNYDYQSSQQQIIDAENLKKQQGNVTAAQNNNLSVIQAALANSLPDEAIGFLQAHASEIQQAVGAENYNALVQSLIGQLPGVKTQKQTNALAYLNAALAGYTPEQMLQYLMQNAQAIIESIGADNYNAVVKNVRDEIKALTTENKEYGIKEAEVGVKRDEIAFKYDELNLKSIIDTGKLDNETKDSIMNQFKIENEALDAIRKNLIEGAKVAQGDRQLNIAEFNAQSEDWARRQKVATDNFLAEIQKGKLTLDGYELALKEFEAVQKANIASEELKLDKWFKEQGIEQEWIKTNLLKWKTENEASLNAFIAQNEASLGAAKLALEKQKAATDDYRAKTERQNSDTAKDRIALDLDKLKFDREQFDEKNYETTYNNLVDQLSGRWQQEIEEETTSLVGDETPNTKRKFKVITEDGKNGIIKDIVTVVNNMGQGNIDQSQAERIAFDLGNTFGIKLEKKVVGQFMQGYKKDSGVVLP